MQPQRNRPISQRLAAVMVAVIYLAGSISDTVATSAGSLDQPTGSNQTVEVLPHAPIASQRPLTPPPSMSIMPAQPYMAPDADDAQTQGCPVRNLKPLDLLV